MRLTVSLGIAKPMPTEPPVGETIAVLIADHLAVHVERRPARVAGVDGRVELQEVVERTGADVAAPAETMPAVTDPPRPNGLPAARIQSPTSTLWLSPQVTTGKRLRWSRP